MTQWRPCLIRRLAEALAAERLDNRITHGERNDAQTGEAEALERYRLAADALAAAEHDLAAEREKVQRVVGAAYRARRNDAEVGPEELLVICGRDSDRAALASEGPAETTLHADRALPPEIAQALVDLAEATVEGTQPPSYAVFVCAQGVTGCRAMGEHQEHDLAKRPFIRAEDSSGDAQAVAFGEGAADQPKGEGCPETVWDGP